MFKISLFIYILQKAEGEKMLHLVTPRNIFSFFFFNKTKIY